MTAVERVVDVLGGQAVLKRPVRTWRELEDAVNDGLPKRALQVVAGRALPEGASAGALVYRVVPIATFKRRHPADAGRERPHRTPRPHRRARRGHLGGARRRARVPQPASIRCSTTARRLTSPPRSSGRGASSSFSTMPTTASRSDAALRAYRIGSRRHRLFDGTGAAGSDAARWNSRGRQVIYASEHYATAVLEKLAQLNSVKLPASLAYIEIVVPRWRGDRTGATVSTVKRWDAEDKAESQAFGDRWYDQQRTAVLLMPSLAAPGLEWNVAINQQHPDFTRLTASTLRPVVGHPICLGDSSLRLRWLNGITGGGGRGPRPLEVEAAQVACDVHDLPDEIQASGVAGLHGL